MSTPCAVYRVFAADGRLLYVGCSPSPLVRAHDHALTKAWGAEIATITVAWFPSRVEAAEAEFLAISKEAPEWNVHFKIAPKHAVGIYHPKYRRDDPSTWLLPQGQSDTGAAA